ncbi:alpha/beta fold hydrolase [Mycetocola sp.]|jgi:phospholipase/carboxylesterase|uniref:alpha/beta hydrolase n=1 Tax=Mycetocola sp. TaxID=1871042 RepID=UPI002608C332|nr:alpha/beta fold hydrolase [Mycetocola sp.]MCU1560513.1 putative esterase [Mycetocola sp.]
MSVVIEVAVRRPADPAAQPGQPLLLFLHGFGSHEGDLAGLASFLPNRFDWVSLRAPIGISASGFAWFPITTPGQPEPAPVHDATEAVLQWLDSNVDESTPVVPIGFSQGGLMVTQLLRHSPARFAAGVVLSGFSLDAVLPGDEELARLRPPVFFGRGDADGVISPQTTARITTWLPAHSTLTEKVYPGLAHSISAEELGDISAFLDEAVPTTDA